MRELIGAAALAERVRQLGEEVTRDYGRAQDLVLLAVLKGAFVFAADLARAIAVPLRIEFITARSYAGTEGGEVHLSAEALPLAGADVLIVEDIIERGTTLSLISALAARMEPASLAICTLLRKPMAPPALPVRYTGFDIGPEFVVGYGLDYDGRYRNLPSVMVLE